MPSIQSSSSGLLGSLFERAQDAIFALSSCLPCTPETSVLKLNGRNFQIVKLLGEGGFSFVYLVKDQESGRLFALKKIRCSGYGADSFQEAMKEIEATKRFRSPHIIPIYDSCVVQDDAGSGTLFGNLPTNDPDGGGGGRGGDGGKVIYLFLPFYEKGKLARCDQCACGKRDEVRRARNVAIVLGDVQSGERDASLPFAECRNDTS